MRTMKRLWERTRRGTCLILCILMLFLGYRSATAILGIAGVAHNPTEGGIPGNHEQIAARENKPRPARQRLAGEVLRIRKARATNADSRLRKILLLQENTPQRLVCFKSGSSAQVESELSKPQYLRLFLPASPGAPQSPPG